ncbi:MAG: thioredoxin family protein [Myxococcota bacterium]
MAEIADVTDDTFEREVTESDLPALVDFWGDHCPACRQISPILQELAEEYSGRLKVLKIHASENAATSARFGVRAMPTVLLFQQGTVKGQLVGARPKGDFVALADSAL